jgi:hypothetical protein
VAHINTLPETETVGAVFREGFVEAEGFLIRYTEAGEGPAAAAPAPVRRTSPDPGA